MDQIHNFFIGNTAANYVEAGFTDREAQAMSWIADQKPMGKFYGFLAGAFVAATWGHFHQRIFSQIGIRCHKLYSQVFIVGAFIFTGDYVTCGLRYGANEVYANKLYLNNNLFMANLKSLNDNFEVLNRKFTAEEVKTFNQRAKALRSRLPLESRKWIFNPNIETQEEFERRRKLNISAPWEDEQIREQIKAENPGKNIVFGPKELGKLIDETGEKVGIQINQSTFWRPI